jgi:hypothetical protein
MEGSPVKQLFLGRRELVNSLARQPVDSLLDFGDDGFQVLAARGRKPWATLTTWA